MIAPKRANYLRKGCKDISISGSHKAHTDFRKGLEAPESKTLSTDQLANHTEAILLVRSHLNVGVECNTPRVSLHKESKECGTVQSSVPRKKNKGSRTGPRFLTFSQVEGVRRGNLIIYLLIQGTECAVVSYHRERVLSYCSHIITLSTNYCFSKKN